MMKSDDLVDRLIAGRADKISHATVYKLIVESLSSDTKMPSRGSPSVGSLALMLNSLRFIAEERENLAEEKQHHEQIGTAITIILTLLPPHRENFVLSIEAHERHLREATTCPAIRETLAKGVASGREDLATIDRLILAARSMRERSLPCLLNGFVLSTAAEKWTGFAPSLLREFQRVLPGRPKAAGYRFIMNAAPLVTGEKPSLFAVESEFKKRRFVKRGNAS